MAYEPADQNMDSSKQARTDNLLKIIIPTEGEEQTVESITQDIQSLLGVSEELRDQIRSEGIDLDRILDAFSSTVPKEYDNAEVIDKAIARLAMLSYLFDIFFPANSTIGPDFSHHILKRLNEFASVSVRNFYSRRFIERTKEMVANMVEQLNYFFPDTSSRDNVESKARSNSWAILGGAAATVQNTLGGVVTTLRKRAASMTAQDLSENESARTEEGEFTGTELRKSSDFTFKTREQLAQEAEAERVKKREEKAAGLLKILDPLIKGLENRIADYNSGLPDSYRFAFFGSHGSQDKAALLRSILDIAKHSVVVARLTESPIPKESDDPQAYAKFSQDLKIAFLKTGHSGHQGPDGMSLFDALNQHRLYGWSATAGSTLICNNHLRGMTVEEFEAYQPFQESVPPVSSA